MAVRLLLDGIDEFRAQLRQLPHDLQQQAGAVVIATAQQTAQDVRANYPEVTGNLRRGVSASSKGSSFAVQATVRSGAPHAHLFESGTGPRQTRSGANRGSMRQGRESQRFIPRAIRARAKMFAQLIAIVEKAGFEVNRA